MPAQIIDGKAIALELRGNLKEKISQLVTEGNRPPTLAVILIGDDPASHVYVGHKEKACASIGIRSVSHRLGEQTTQAELEALLKKLAKDDGIDGMLLQLPLPSHLKSAQALDCIPVEKDVDGLSPENQGRLLCRRPGLFSCTPLGCMDLIRKTGLELRGATAAVIGRSLLVGAPLATMIGQRGATVTGIHSKTQDPKKFTRDADLLVAAAGVHHLVDASWVKPGAVVIDVGMHRIDGKLAGDVDFDSVKEVASYITPVPGGVGPMTIAKLLENCVISYERNIAKAQLLS